MRILTYFLFAIAYLFEIARRIQCYTSPSTHLMQRRVKSFTPGRLQHGKSKYAVFVLNCIGPLPTYLRSIIDSFAAYEVDVLIVTNVLLAADTKTFILSRSYGLLERENIGRDFGAYKDGIAHLMGVLPDASHLFLCNDSVYYLSGSTDRLVSDCLSAGSFTGVTESYAACYHVQSFFLCFDHTVINSPAFVRFWQSYLPIDTRLYAIKNGEIALTVKLKRAGHVPFALYTPSRMASILRNCEAAQIQDTLGLLPTSVAFRAITEGISIRRSPLVEVDRLALLTQVDQLTPFAKSQVLLRMIGSGNTISICAFLFRSSLGFPLLKRDIVFRGVFEMSEVTHLLEYLDIPDREDIIFDLVRRGRIADLPINPVAKHMYKIGLL